MWVVWMEEEEENFVNDKQKYIAIARKCERVKS